MEIGLKTDQNIGMIYIIIMIKSEKIQRDLLTNIIRCKKNKKLIKNI